MERKAREEAERRIRAEIEQKAREEAERKIRAEMEQKIREETERRLKGSADRETKSEPAGKAKEKTEKAPPRDAGHPDATGRFSAKAQPSSQDSKDDFMTIAVADIYIRQGLFEEAYKIFHRITEMEPDNFEAKKKLSDLETLMKAKGIRKPSETVAASPPPVKEAPAAVPAPQGVSPHEKDSVAKKKHGKVGYV
jgi:hypothetical protein